MSLASSPFVRSSESSRQMNGYVSRIENLPAADKSYAGAVVFCYEDKRFYECRNIVTDTEDYYRWIAVTTGGQRIFFIPVEKLTTEESEAARRAITIRNNSFDACMSALNEIAVGISRYNVHVDPLCYIATTDIKYVEGKQYYKYNNDYERSAYVKTKDSTPVAGKVYFVINGDIFESYIFGEGESFVTGTDYYESTRPAFLPITTTVGSYVDMIAYVESDLKIDAVTFDDLIVKYNELAYAINVTGSKLSMIDLNDNDFTLYNLCELINVMIDEVNPFSVPWNNALERILNLEDGFKSYAGIVERVSTLEGDAVELQSQIDDITRKLEESVLVIPTVISKDGVKYTLDFNEGDGSRMLVCNKHTDQTADHKFLFPLEILRNGVTYYLDIDVEDGTDGTKMVVAKPAS